MAVVLYPNWLAPGIIDLDGLAIMFFLAPFFAADGAVFALNGFFMTESFLFTFFFAPALYFFSPGFSAIGMKFGEIIRKTGVESDTQSNIESLLVEQEDIVTRIDSTN